MVSGIPTSSGFEERIRFSEIEIVDANAIDTGVLTSLPEGNYLNGWDVNIAGVRMVSVRRKFRHQKHAVSSSLDELADSMLTLGAKEFLLRVKRKGEREYYISRRYGDFAQLYKRLRTELPGRVLPHLPHKNKSNTRAPNVIGGISANESETSSLSSVSTQMPNSPGLVDGFGSQADTSQRLLTVKGWLRSYAHEVATAYCLPPCRSPFRRGPLSPCFHGWQAA